MNRSTRSYMRLAYSARPSVMGRHISPEIWQDIFVYCLPDLHEVTYHHTSDLVRPSKFDAPLLLLLVCKTWRYWALRTPRLWARLSVRVSWGKSYPPLPQAFLWLKRSKSVPLTFSLRQNGDWAADHIMTSKLLQRFLCHVHRWQHVSLHLCCALALSTLAKHNDIVPRDLRSMYLSLVASTEVLAMTDEFSVALNHFTSAPNFSSLVISGINVFQCLKDHHLIQWERLTEVKLDDVNYVDTCLALFSICKNLVRCTIGVLETAYPPASEHYIHAPPEIITLPHLTFLSLNINEADICKIFSQLHVPELHELTVYSYAQTWPQAVFSSWLERSKCALTRVEFHDTRMQQEQFLQCLRLASFATVTELVMDEEGFLPEDWTGFISKAAIEELTVREHSGGCLLPKLGTLDLSGRCVEDSGAAVIEMIASRHDTDVNGVARFRKFSWSLVADYDYLESEDLNTLEALRNHGLEVNVCRGGVARWY
ncbi:hypothetical protein DFS33DRAFT_976139 [Desarmillaria ectypa]|nr:hypothetical protein DFS33DRAFT_976139 [Desarmillaria ectypa]